MRERGRLASHNEGQDDPSTRPKQLRNREVPWEGSLWSKLMSRRTERPYKVDGTGQLARHSAVRRSAPEINGPVVQQEFTSLLREVCSPSPVGHIGRADSAMAVVRPGEVSRGHSSEVGPSPRPELVSGGSTAIALPETMKPSGRVIAQRLLQLEHGASSERPIGTDSFPGKPASCMAPGKGQWRGGWSRWDDHRPVSRFCPGNTGRRYVRASGQALIIRQPVRRC